MAGRGRGRGKSVSFNVEALGFGRGEALPATTLQPPPLYPPQEFKPVPLLQGEDYEYLLALKQEFRSTIRKSPYYIHPAEKRKDIERYSDKYQIGAHDVADSWTPDWSRLPAELKIREKKVKKLNAAVKPKIPTDKKKADDKEISKTLEILEKKEDEMKDKEEGDEKEEEEEEEKEGEGDEEEEEILDEDDLEEETDYAMNYFDNGEGYGDDDDDVDEGPVY